MKTPEDSRKGLALAPADSRLIADFRRAVAELSPEKAAELVGEGVSAPTLRRYMGGETPKRMTTDVRLALRRFLQSRDDLEGSPPDTGPALDWAQELRLLVRAEADRAAALREVAVAARLAEENARDLRVGMFSLDPRDHRDAATAARAAGLARKHLPPDDAPGAGSPRRDEPPPDSE